MAYKISDECISCGACAAECPVSAISEGNGKFEIDPDTCIECGACAETCPVFRLCTPLGTRTLDTLIKSQVLYQLS